MLEASQTIMNKLVLHIVKNEKVPSELSLPELVWGALADQVGKMFGLCTTWETFTHGGQFSDADHFSRAQTALAKFGNESMLWALHLQCKDAVVTRRRWIYQVGFLQASSDKIVLYYAKSYYDHMAGSIMQPKAVPMSLDKFPDCLFFDKHINCMCGDNALPLEPLELSHSSIPDFIFSLQNDQRTIPIVLITCTWALIPEEIQDIMRGNAIIYWCDDANVVMRLNALLPGTMFTPWESVHIFVPLRGERQFHPVYLYEDIHRMEEINFIYGLYQAFCQSLRSEDKRNFLTISDVQKTRDKTLLDKLIAQSETHVRESKELKEKIVCLEGKVVSLTEETQRLHSQKADIAEYESLLNDTMKETDALKNGISALSAQLYSTMGIGFQPNKTEKIAQLQELADAIYACLACVRSKK